MERLKRLFRPKCEPDDPYAYVSAPLRCPPRNRGGAAVAELDEKWKATDEGFHVCNL